VPETARGLHVSLHRMAQKLAMAKNRETDSVRNFTSDCTSKQNHRHQGNPTSKGIHLNGRIEKRTSPQIHPAEPDPL